MNIVGRTKGKMYGKSKANKGKDVWLKWGQRRERCRDKVGPTKGKMYRDTVGPVKGKMYG